MRNEPATSETTLELRRYLADASSFIVAEAAKIIKDHAAGELAVGEKGSGAFVPTPGKDPPTLFLLFLEGYNRALTRRSIRWPTNGTYCATGTACSACC